MREKEIKEIAKSLNNGGNIMLYQDLIQEGKTILLEDPTASSKKLYNSMRKYFYREKMFNNKTSLLFEDNNYGLIYQDAVDIDKLTIQMIIEKLPEPNKSIVILTYYYNYTQYEIANELDINQPKVSKILNLTLQYIKEKLEN